MQTRMERNAELHKKVKEKNEKHEMLLKNSEYIDNQQMLSAVDPDFFGQSSSEIQPKPKSINKKVLFIGIGSSIFFVFVIILIILLVSKK